MRTSLLRAVGSACVLELLVRFGFPDSQFPRLLLVSGLLIASSALFAEVAHFVRLALNALCPMIESLGDLSRAFFALLILVSWQFADFKQMIRVREHTQRRRCYCGSGKLFKECHGKEHAHHANVD
jgi:hypothetical protein